MRPFALAGRTILLTGAGRGIGLALLSELIKRGIDRIIVVGRDEDQLRRLERQYPQVVAVAVDLSIRAQLEGLVAQVRGFPELSVLINNAGTQQLSDLMDPEADLHRPALAAEMAVNFSAPIELTVSLLPRLLL